MDSSQCVGTGGRPRWLMIRRIMAWLCSIVASAQANLWSSAAYVVASEHTASITAASSLELTRTCSGECCAVYEGPGVSAGARAEGGGGEKSGNGLLSTSTSTQEQDHLPLGDPLLPHLAPPPGPAAGGEKRSAWSRIAPWTGLEGT